MDTARPHMTIMAQHHEIPRQVVRTELSSLTFQWHNMVDFQSSSAIYLYLSLFRFPPIQITTFSRSAIFTFVICPLHGSDRCIIPIKMVVIYHHVSPTIPFELGPVEVFPAPETSVLLALISSQNGIASSVYQHRAGDEALQFRSTSKVKSVHFLSAIPHFLFCSCHPSLSQISKWDRWFSIQFIISCRPSCFPASNDTLA